MKNYLSAAIEGILPADVQRPEFSRYEIDGLNIVAVIHHPVHVSHGPVDKLTGQRKVSGGGYTRQILGSVTAEDVANIMRLASRLEADAIAADSAKQAADNALAAWIGTLPDRLDDETVINRACRQLEDNWGNRLCGLPSTPVEDLAAWCDDRLADYSGD